MQNKRGYTMKQRISEDIEYAKNIENIDHKKILLAKALGAADIAVEFNLITYTEWGKFVSRIFNIM